MAKPLISEVLQGLTEVEGKELHKARVAYLQQKSSPALKDVLRINFDEAVVSLLPAGEPPYRKDPAPAGMNYATLHKAFRKFKYFFNTGLELNQGSGAA